MARKTHGDAPEVGASATRGPAGAGPQRAPRAASAASGRGGARLVLPATSAAPGHCCLPHGCAECCHRCRERCRRHGGWDSGGGGAGGGGDGALPAQLATSSHHACKGYAAARRCGRNHHNRAGKPSVRAAAARLLAMGASCRAWRGSRSSSCRGGGWAGADHVHGGALEAAGVEGPRCCCGTGASAAPSPAARTPARGRRSRFGSVCGGERPPPAG
mmetsp:Transcript_15397/g.46478  ORF Transcript_15397/g.46478 Transcript_15397/m.46478 type:complete len:217 (+) Transcript_15397:741-1391(+)